MIRLISIILSMALAQHVLAAPSRMVTGAEIAILAQKILADQNIDAKPMIDIGRDYNLCESELDINPSREGDWRLLTVQCEAPKSWSISLRTSSSAPENQKVSIMPDLPEGGLAVILNKSLTRGSVITANDLSFAPVKMTKGMQFFSNTADVVGRKIKRTVSKGQPIRASHLDISWLILKNSPIQIEAASSGIQITISGISLENGQLGDIIKVKNAMSGIIVDAFVESSQKVSPVANIP